MIIRNHGLFEYCAWAQAFSTVEYITKNSTVSPKKYDVNLFLPEEVDFVINNIFTSLIEEEKTNEN